MRPCHLDRDALSARPEVACRYRTGRVALGETARLKIVPQVRQEGKGVPAILRRDGHVEFGELQNSASHVWWLGPEWGP